MVFENSCTSHNTCIWLISSLMIFLCQTDIFVDLNCHIFVKNFNEYTCIFMLSDINAYCLQENDLLSE